MNSYRFIMDHSGESKLVKAFHDHGIELTDYDEHFDYHEDGDHVIEIAFECDLSFDEVCALLPEDAAQC